MPAEVRKILYCTDLSENANVALRYAAYLAKLTGADMHVLHVVEELSGDAKVNVSGELGFLDGTGPGYVEIGSATVNGGNGEQAGEQRNRTGGHVDLSRVGVHFQHSGRFRRVRSRFTVRTSPPAGGVARFSIR